MFDKATYNREYYQTHRTKILTHQREYYQIHTNERIVYHREYYQTHADEVATWGREYRLARVTEIAARKRKYNQTYPERKRAMNARYKTRKLGASGADYTTAEMVSARWEMWGNRCWINAEHEAEATDHVKPIAKGGSNFPCNLRPICNSCNSKKRDKWPYPANKHDQ